ncbi:MAG TPA: hypothetical protein VFD64_12625 [Gemmatimonadaceae bacterium]|nr:hypothetical protein [Gemmatimonadaceae bacterium]
MKRLILSTLILAGVGCSDSSGPDDARFVFRDPLTQDVVTLEVNNSEGRAQAEDLLNSGEARWALGTLRRGDGGFNAPWTWHIDPATVTFAEVTIEACQTAMSAIDDDLDYWIDFGQVCIWGVVESRAN